MSANVLELNGANFRAAVEDGTTPILVDFWAPWCGPCRMLAPELEAAAAELEGRVRIAKVNVDESPELAERFGVSSIPNLVLFRDGRPVRQMVGFMDRRRLAEAVSAA